MDDGPVQIYLASIWLYHEAGVERVLGALRKHHPGGQYTFEEDAGWFKVSCQAGDVLKVQAIFRDIHREMERGLGPKKIPENNRWIKLPNPGNLPKKPAGDIIVDQLCPVTFDRFAFRKVWTRVKTDTPENILMHKILSEEDRKSIMAETGAQLAVDSTCRLVYIGADTKVAVANASKMIDNLFCRYVFVMPSPKHLLYAEIDSAYHVDARYMAHVNDTMLTSTILDPSQYPTEALLEKMLKSVFSKGVCLRICEVDHFKRIEVSLFGPRAGPIFNDQARKWPMWFKRIEYTPKAIGVSVPNKAQEAALAPVQKPVSHTPEPVSQRKQETAAQRNELICLSESPRTNGKNKCQESVKPNSLEQVDMLGLDLSNMSDGQDAPKALPPAPSAPATPPDTPPEDKELLLAILPPMPSSYQSEKYSYEMKLLWDFMNNSLKISSGQAAAKPVKLIEDKPETRLIETAPEAKLVNDTPAATPAETSGADNDLSVKGNVKPKPQDGPVKPEIETAPLIDFFDDIPAPAAAAAQTKPQGGPGKVETEAAQLIDVFDDKPVPAVVAEASSKLPPVPEQTDLLIEIDSSDHHPSSPPRLPTSPSQSQKNQPVPNSLNGKTRSAAHSGSARMSKALVRRSTFASSLCHSIGRLMADLPFSRGRIRLQVELGRLYIMDANPEGLAFNAPGEPATGWPPTEITTRLDAICVSPESIVFSRALTLFANDMESVLGLNASVLSQNMLTNGSGSIIDGDGSGFPCNSLPDWAFHEKRIVYEFKCQRVYKKGNAGSKAASPFVIEIDGTKPGAFTYAIRSVEDTRPPIWIHCIRRHWDARVSVSFSQTDKLEAEYGDFARELLRSLVVPPGPITNPKFQFAYDHRETKKGGQSFSTMVLSARIRNIGRFVSADQQSYLDVSWNWLMALVKRPGKEGATSGTMHATPAPDNPSRGQFTSWYEASIVSAEAEAAFRENETLPAGGMAAWGTVGTAALDEIFESAFNPALQLVKKMDGVGVLVDNGQAERTWTPPTTASKVARAVKNFW
ncbi:hypothetical protein SEUCBS140593_002369 [Sporothrix eucalyptigena]|uniref:Uncharacterized protein n=1 Tax=Sporothrix eucalyptigena TaxID=1812306 RepID=A0ABP0B5U3_9PEZI